DWSSDVCSSDLLSARCLATSVRVPTLQDAALLRARLATADGDTPAAEHALREALDLGRPDQRRRPFADAGPWLRQMLHQRPDLTAAHPWLSRRLGPALPEDC